MAGETQALTGNPSSFGGTGIGQVTPVTDLLDAQQNPVANTGSTPNATPAAAGAAGAAPPNVIPPALGRTAPNTTDAAKPAPSGSAKDLQGSAIAVSATGVTSNAGVLTRAQVTATWKNDQGHSVTTGYRTQWTNPADPSKSDVVSNRVWVAGKVRVLDDPKLKADLSLEGFGQTNTPLDGGPTSVQLGINAAAGFTYKPASNVTLAAKPFIEATRTWSSGTKDSIVIGGEGSVAVALNKDITLKGEIRGEHDVLADKSRLATELSVAKQFGKDTSLSIGWMHGWIGGQTFGPTYVEAGRDAFVLRFNKSL